MIHRSNIVHKLKCWPEYFQACWVGDKSFEIRLNDRDFKERDEITLEEYNPTDEDYTGRSIDAVIMYLTNFEQKDGYVVFNFRELGRQE